MMVVVLLLLMLLLLRMLLIVVLVLQPEHLILVKVGLWARGLASGTRTGTSSRCVQVVLSRAATAQVAAGSHVDLGQAVG